MAIANATLPGTRITFTGAQGPSIPPSASETVAIPLVTDWGPVGSDPPGADGKQGGAQLLDSFAAYTSQFGDSDTPGRTAVAGAFAGQGLPGQPGAGGVLAYRIGGVGVAPATVNLTSVAVAAPNVLTLQGYYKGTRGNRITYAVDANPSNPAQDRLRIYFDGVLREAYLYSPGTGDNITALVAAINNASRLVRAIAVAGASTDRLTQTPVNAPAALAGGNDGAVPTGSDHLAALNAVAYRRFGVIAPYDLTDGAIQASYVSWVQAQAAASRPCRLVLGGAAGESVATAVTRSAALADEHVINFGGGTYHDDLLGKDLSTSQLAPRIAGILAAKGQSHSLTFSKIGGMHVVVGPADDEVQVAVDGGVVVLAPTSAPDADVVIEKGVTTFTTPNDAAKPLDVFSDARLIGIMDGYVADMKQWGDDKVVGDLPVNDDTRNLVRGEARRLEDALLTAGLILPANPNANPPVPAPWVVCVDPGDPTQEDKIPYTFGWKFAKTANQIVGQGAIN